MNADKPQRACVLTVKIEADSPLQMVRAVNCLADGISRGELSTGCWGSPDHGAIYEYMESDSPTHDEYFAQLRAYLDAKHAPKPSDTSHQPPATSHDSQDGGAA
jgi:hypothetical protein